MKNSDLQVRIGVIAKLETVLDADIPIRDTMRTPDDPLPCVLLTTQTNVPDPLKQTFGTQSTILIQVIGKKSLTISRYEIDLIADKILKALIPNASADYFTVTGFQVVQVRLDSLNDDTVTDSDGNAARKLIRLRIILREQS